MDIRYIGNKHHTLKEGKMEQKEKIDLLFSDPLGCFL